MRALVAVVVVLVLARVAAAAQAGLRDDREATGLALAGPDVLVLREPSGRGPQLVAVPRAGGVRGADPVGAALGAAVGRRPRVARRVRTARRGDRGARSRERAGRRSPPRSRWPISSQRRSPASLAAHRRRSRHGRASERRCPALRRRRDQRRPGARRTDRCADPGRRRDGGAGRARPACAAVARAVVLESRPNCWGRGSQGRQSPRWTTGVRSCCAPTAPAPPSARAPRTSPR